MLGPDTHANSTLPLELRTPVMIGVMTASALMEAEEE